MKLKNRGRQASIPYRSWPPPSLSIDVTNIHGRFFPKIKRVFFPYFKWEKYTWLPFGFKPYNMPDEIDFIKKFKDGDQSALQFLFSKNYQALLKICGSITKDENDCQKILENAFMSLWADREIISTIDDADTYLASSVILHSQKFMSEK